MFPYPAVIDGNATGTTSKNKNPENIFFRKNRSNKSFKKSSKIKSLKPLLDRAERYCFLTKTLVIHSHFLLPSFIRREKKRGK